MQPSFCKELEKLEEEKFNLVEIINQSYGALVEFHEKICSQLTERLDQEGLVTVKRKVTVFDN